MSRAELDSNRRSGGPRTGRPPQSQRRSMRGCTIGMEFVRTDVEEKEETNTVKDHLTRNILKYKGENPNNRPRIRRMSKEMLETVERINTLIRDQISDISTLSDLVDSVYERAITVGKIHDAMPTTTERLSKMRTILGVSNKS
ncbi:hypothetical protein HHI36_018733 [Cryptolaemus montrouzieri]|uniref:Uncharacterized protein n=1 Tax=Cryptolaemus montrouzieri TaxID=559131 RepID=A0ABD2P1P4_9CUCU